MAQVPEVSVAWSPGYPVMEYLDCLAVGHNMVIVTGNTTTYAMNMNGTMLWSYSGDNYSHSPIISNDGIIVLASYDQIIALNQDGSVRWVCITGNCCQSSPIIGSDGTIYIPAVYGDTGTITAISHYATPWGLIIGIVLIVIIASVAAIAFLVTKRGKK